MKSLQAALPVALALLASCGAEPDLRIYCALDMVHSEPLIQRFAEETGLDVEVDFDVEATKTVGLVNRIREEQGRPRCDVFWNNEIAHTVALANEGLLRSYDSPTAADIPETFRDPDRRWTGFAARARVFIVNTELADPAEIRGMDDLFDPKWAGKVGMARPLTGTTLTHMAALFTTVGEARAEEYLRAMKSSNENGQLDLTSGNATLMRKVRDGFLAWGWTDTDDYYVAREAGAPVAVVYPDQDGVGTLLIPNTICITRDAPHPEAAERFVDWVLRPEIEAELARSRTMQIPVRPDVPRPDHVPGAEGDELKYMEVDFLRVGAELVERQAAFQEMFLD